MTVFTLHFDGASIQREANFHEAVREQSGIEWYGANLDAWWDMLVNVIPSAWGRFNIEWTDYDLSMPDEHQRKIMIIGIAKEAEEHVPDRLAKVRLTFSEPVYADGDDPFYLSEGRLK